MATVNRRICGISNNESVLGTSMPDARLEDNKYLNDCIFDFRQKLRALPAFLQDLNATYTRNSEKRVVQDGALVTLAANQFGTSYDPVTGLYGYVPEPAATNELTYSVDFSNAAWLVNDGVKTSTSAAAPDGTNTALVFTSTATTNTYIRRTLTSSSAARTVSIFFKKDPSAHRWWRFLIFDGTSNQARCWFDMRNAVLGTVQSNGTATGTSALITHIGGDWYRVSVSGTVANSNLMQISPQTGDGSVVFASGAVGTFWFGQCESGMRATSPIYTTSSTATRAADVLSVPLANIPGFSAAGYTLFADGRADIAATSIVRRSLYVDDGSVNNRVTIGADASGNYFNTITSGGVAQASTIETAAGVARGKFAAASSVNSFIRSVNGIAGTADTLGSMPLSPTTLRVGVAPTGTEQFNGFIFRAGLVPQALTQAQINGMTA